MTYHTIISPILGGIMEANLYFEPEIIEDLITAILKDKLKRDDISTIADIVRMMVSLDISCVNPKRSIATLKDLLGIDAKSASILLEVTKSRPIPTE